MSRLRLGSVSFLLCVLTLVGIGSSAAVTSKTCGVSTVPVVFVPGYAASSPKPDTITQYAFNRGASPTTLNLSPSYSPLMRSLGNANYKEGLSFFGAVYDWRMPLAPTDGVNDGILESVTAPSITAGNFSCAINYLGYWLDQAMQANPGLTCVDVVTHSTGGPLIRAYIQSPAYGGEYLDSHGIRRHLPTIRYLILGACIHFGTVHSWRPWNADFQDVEGGLIPTTEIEGRFAAAGLRLCQCWRQNSGARLHDHTLQNRGERFEW